MSHGHNAEFLKDPKAYLGAVTVLTVGSIYKGFDPNVPRDKVYMDLVLLDSGMKSGTKLVRADFRAEPEGDAPIEGGWIPYIAEGTVNADPAKLPALRLPDGRPRFVFTGAMNGCSLVLANGPDGKYGIHYPNSKGAPVGFPHLKTGGFTYVKSVDYYDLKHPAQGFYGTAQGVDPAQAASAAGNDTGWFNTFACFHHDGLWKILAQPQFAWQQGTEFRARTTGEVIEL